jgi:XTP/dITP diphosphohydrolase
MGLSFLWRFPCRKKAKTKMSERRMRVVLASTNEGKVRELNRLLDESLVQLVNMKEVVSPDFEIEETEATFEGNAWLKAEACCTLTGLPSISDDSGLEVDALGGRPGVYSARYAGPSAKDEDNNRLLLTELSGVPQAERSARFRCALAFVAPSPVGPKRIVCVHGVIEGRIVEQERGEHGFGYDPLFEPQAYQGRTTAEISVDEKNRISHRGGAALLLRPHLLRWLAEHRRP